MKRLLTIMILAPMFAGAQVNSDSLFLIMESESTGHWLPIYDDTIPIGKMDTVAVRMLVSGIQIRVDETHNRIEAAYVIRGYEVNIRKPFVNEPGSFCPTCPNYWEHVMYLDWGKKPLGKHIEVWYVKPTLPGK